MCAGVGRLPDGHETPLPGCPPLPSLHIAQHRIVGRTEQLQHGRKDLNQQMATGAATLRVVCDPRQGISAMVLALAFLSSQSRSNWTSLLSYSKLTRIASLILYFEQCTRESEVSAVHRLFSCAQYAKPTKNPLYSYFGLAFLGLLADLAPIVL